MGKWIFNPEWDARWHAALDQMAEISGAATPEKRTVLIEKLTKLKNVFVNSIYEKKIETTDRIEFEKTKIKPLREVEKTSMDLYRSLSLLDQ